MTQHHDGSGGGQHADALEQAAEWFAYLQGDGVTATARENWRQWLQASEAHRDAWERVEHIDRQFRELPARPACRALEAAGGGRRRFLKSLAGLALVTPLGWTAWRELPTESWGADLQTATGEIREIALPDGGRLWLNTATAVNLDYSAAHRRVTLLAGEIHLQTAADSRPLHVETPYGTAVPLGTSFTVRLQGDTARVSVSEGRVAVTPGQATEPRVVAAGRALSFDQQSASTPVAATAQHAAWRRSVLVADNLPLGEFLDELNRYRPGVIRYDDRAARLRLVGAYPLADTDRVLAALEQSLPVKVSRLTPWWVRVAARD